MGLSVYRLKHSDVKGYAGDADADSRDEQMLRAYKVGQYTQMYCPNT